MQASNGRRIVAVALAAAALITACTTTSDTAGPGEEPARVEPVQGMDVKRVVLTDRAAQRVGIETAQVSTVPGKPFKVVPYAAVLYDPDGRTWAYTVTAPLTYVRAPLAVDRIDGDSAILDDGPPPGTTVVTTGAAELLGAENGVGAGE